MGAEKWLARTRARHISQLHAAEYTLYLLVIVFLVIFALITVDRFRRNTLTPARNGWRMIVGEREQSQFCPDADRYRLAQCAEARKKRKRIMNRIR